jgi:hypothetical protein
VLLPLLLLLLLLLPPPPPPLFARPRCRRNLLPGVATEIRTQKGFRF